MRCLFCRRISPWPAGFRINGQGRFGSATLMALFLFFMFSVLGLSLAYLLQVSVRISASKRRSVVLNYAAENGLKQGWDQLAGLIAGRGFPLLISDGRLAELKGDFASGGGAILQESLGAGGPYSARGGWENEAWESETRFVPGRLQETENYFLAAFSGTTIAKGTTPDSRASHTSTAETFLEIAAGRVPLSIFPMLVNRPEDPAEAEGYAQSHRLSFTSWDRGLAVPLLNFAPPDLLSQDACPALSQALQVKLFKPQDLTRKALRRALRLEESDDPVPEGVYLIRTDLGLGGIYVQGDLDELLLAIDQADQVLVFRGRAGQWVLRFNPQAQRTSFSSPEETFSFDVVPAGIVVVNGKVRSLGGGRADGSGEFVFCREEEVPCLLRGVQLTIVSSDTMTLTGNLIRQGVSWQNGIPYVKDADSKLTLFSTGRDFTSESPTEGGIVIAQDSPRDMKIEASLVAPGRGFLVEGEDKVVRLAGSIQASEIRNSSNALNITFDSGKRVENIIDPALPLTAQPVLLVRKLRLLSWRDAP